MLWQSSMKKIFRKEECQKENQKLKKKLREKEEELIALEEANTLLKDEHFALQARGLINLLVYKNYKFVFICNVVRTCNVVHF